jgi:hypothetical protein
MVHTVHTLGLHVLGAFPLVLLSLLRRRPKICFVPVFMSYSKYCKRKLDDDARANRRFCDNNGACRKLADKASPAYAARQAKRKAEAAKVARIRLDHERRRRTFTPAVFQRISIPNHIVSEDENIKPQCVQPGVPRWSESSLNPNYINAIGSSDTWKCRCGISFTYKAEICLECGTLQSDQTRAAIVALLRSL